MIRTARVVDPAEAPSKDAAGSGAGGRRTKAGAGRGNAGAGPSEGGASGGTGGVGRGGSSPGPGAETVPAGTGFVLVMNDDVPSAKAASSRRFWGVRERAYRVSDPKGLSPVPGDTVEISLPQGRTVLSASLTFLLPLALFPAGFALAGRILPAARSAASGAAAAGGSAAAEGMAFLVGFAFLLAGFPLGALIRRIVGSRSAVPEITRVLTPAEALSCRAKDAAGCGSCTRCG